MDFDLNQFDTSKVSNKGGVLHLKHPVTDAPLFVGDKPCTITLLGTDSDVYRKRQNETRAQKTRALVKGRDISLTDEEMINLLAEITIGWGNIIAAGKQLEFSRDAAVQLYTQHTWIREQADEFAGNRANFLPSR